MLHLRYPIVLELTAGERDKALVWLVKNHPKLDCRVDDRDDGSAEIRVRDEDAGVLDALADMLEGA